jgi:phosphoribosyl 1,2-cyclic phosphodiesterase
MNAMRFIQHYSSSKANLYEVVADNGKRLIIDPGAKWKQIEKALDYKLGGIEACFVSHSHADHSKAVYDCWNAGLEVCSTAETFEGMDIDSHRLITLKDKDLIRFPTFEVYAFEVAHDVPNLGFIVLEKTTKEYLLYAVDTCNITQRFKYPFSIIAIECSYDEKILTKRVERGDVDEHYAKRLLTSHFEKQNCIRYLRDFCDRSKLREIHLLHCSRGNIDLKKTCDEIEKEFFIRPSVLGM